MERKLLLSGGKFYFVTVDAEQQLATLHSNRLKSPLKKAAPTPLPAGRNYAEPIVPFCWDLNDDVLFAVNWIQHPLNDRMEALRSFPLKGLGEWTNKSSVQDLLARSVDMPILCTNEPYAAVLRNSNVLEGFYFDAIAATSASSTVVICNQGKALVAEYQQGSWSLGEPFVFDQKEGFVLVVSGNKKCLLRSDGCVFELLGKEIKELPELKLPEALNKLLIVVNKDNNSVGYILNKELNHSLSFKKIMNKKFHRIDPEQLKK